MQASESSFRFTGVETQKADFQEVLLFAFLLVDEKISAILVILA